MVCGRVNSSRVRAKRRLPATVLLRAPGVVSELAGRSELVRQGGEPLLADAPGWRGAGKGSAGRRVVGCRLAGRRAASARAASRQLPRATKWCALLCGATGDPSERTAEWTGSRSSWQAGHGTTSAGVGQQTRHLAHSVAQAHSVNSPPLPGEHTHTVSTNHKGAPCTRTVFAGGTRQVRGEAVLNDVMAGAIIINGAIGTCGFLSRAQLRYTLLDGWGMGHGGVAE
jgi:hypothetical protein